jgi:hypothetical protein
LLFRIALPSVTVDLRAGKFKGLEQPGIASPAGEASEADALKKDPAEAGSQLRYFAGG